MKIAYAFRRGTFYPHVGEGSWDLPRGKARAPYLKKVREIGFDGIELGLETFGGVDCTEAQVKGLAKELKDAATPCVAVRAGGGLCQPNVAARNRKRLEKAVQVAGWAGAEIVNTALSTPSRNLKLGSTPVGAAIQQGSSQLATQDDFTRTAKALREVSQMAGDAGVNITIEVHQHSIADNSWSTLHLLDLTDGPYVFANPDLGNILWQYDVPEETMEQAILALAPRSKYWHCKNLNRVHIPELEHSYFIRGTLPEGDIDYRFAIAAMVEAGYDGYLAVEGATSGDQLYKDQRNFNYVKGILAELGE